VSVFVVLDGNYHQELPVAVWSTLEAAEAHVLRLDASPESVKNGRNAMIHEVPFNEDAGPIPDLGEDLLLRQLETVARRIAFWEAGSNADAEEMRVILCRIDRSRGHASGDEGTPCA
jgi:hypothetical protein